VATVRTSLPDVFRRTMLGVSRSTIRSVSDDHLVQQVDHADVHHSETHTDFERFQHLGFTAVPMPQDKEEGQQQGQQQGGGTQANGAPRPNFNHNQPQGKSAEGIIVYVGANRDHAVMIAMDDRRHRPYGLKPGEGAHYAPDGSGRMFLHRDGGTYMVSCDDGSKKRPASLRHVAKQKQSREIKKGQQQSDFKHEGETVNTELEALADRVNFRMGSDVKGFWDKGTGHLYVGAEKPDNMRRVRLEDGSLAKHLWALPE
jgi:phage gp45-like